MTCALSVKGQTPPSEGKPSEGLSCYETRARVFPEPPSLTLSLGTEMIEMRCFTQPVNTAEDLQNGCYVPLLLHSGFTL